MRSLQIQAPSRLHFGLLGWGPEVPRQFGGVGLMIERPGLDLEVQPADRWVARGPHADRALAVATRLASELERRGAPVPPLAIAIHSAPPAHVGLGSGTQLALALGRAILHHAGRPTPTVSELAAWTGRGHRSGIGLHGFERGGLIVDGGRSPTGGPPPLVARIDFPEDWKILLILPPLPAGLHGHEEVAAFRDLRPTPAAVSDRLCRLILLQLIPSVAENDLPNFGVALAEIQEHVGRGFAPAQGGGLFAHPRLAAIAAVLSRAGLHGIGQSSWGPALYAFCDGRTERYDPLLDALRDQFGLAPDTMFWTRADNRGAVLLEQANEPAE